MDDKMNKLESDVAITSRVRLARNYRDIPFPPMMNEIWAGESVRRTQDALGAVPEGREYTVRKLSELSENERMKMVEHHLISPALLAKGDTAAVMVSGQGDVSVMVNEEDHLRIQALLPGLSLGECYRRAGEVDDWIERSEDYAFDVEKGYLTSCPTNTGTGLRGSVMLHLPVLSMIRQIAPIVQAVGKIGLTVRGIYGEGTEAVGCLYQISNQVTLGRAEEDILESLAATARQLIEREGEARKRLFEQNHIELEDKLMRSWGIFTNARRMDSKEFMKLLSDVRLAVDLDILPGGLRAKIDSLMEDAQPASLNERFGGNVPAQERDRLRAQVVREMMA